MQVRILIAESQRKEVLEYAALPFFVCTPFYPPLPQNVVENAEPYYLYILKSETADRYYVGISSNPHRRLEYHNSFEKGFTSRYRPWQLVFTKEYPFKTEAHAAETKIKGWKSRRMIERLIAGDDTM
jgi:putative endonuclease